MARHTTDPNDIQTLSRPVPTGSQRARSYAPGMEQHEIAEQWPQPGPSPDELRKLKTALRQVEWADTYLLAFANLELDDHELNQAVDDIRLRLVSVELRLRKVIAS
jgi:hypothetical protein